MYNTLGLIVSVVVILAIAAFGIRGCIDKGIGKNPLVEKDEEQ